MAAAYERLSDGLYLIDTGFIRPELAASYLVQGQDTCALVEVGTTLSGPRLLAALASLGVAREAVGYVIVTHVHLDHAGGAGTLMAALPNAKLVVHPRGARHLIDPTKLIQGAIEVYSAEILSRHYGEIRPVPAARVIEAPDEYVVELGGRPLRILDTPGHAKHHFVVYDAHSRGVFTGDTFGISYRHLRGADGPFVFPTTTPVQFDPAALTQSMARMLALNPERMYLTHYGVLEGPVAPYAERLQHLLNEHIRVARAIGAGPDAPSRIKAQLVEVLMASLREHHVDVNQSQALQLWDMDLTLNAQGLAIWIAKPVA